MARVGAVFQDNVYQDNVYQDNDWGLFPFQRTVFQGVNEDVEVFQSNIFQGNIIGNTNDIGAVFDVNPTIVQLINEVLQETESLITYRDRRFTVNESMSLIEFDGLLRAILLAINETLRSSETTHRKIELFRYVNETEALSELTPR